MKKTTRDTMPKPTGFFRKKVPKGDFDDGRFGTLGYKAKERMAAVEALARAKAMEEKLGKDMVDVVIDERTVIRVRRDKAEATEKLYKKRKS